MGSQDRAYQYCSDYALKKANLAVPPTQERSRVSDMRVRIEILTATIFLVLVMLGTFSSVYKKHSMPRHLNCRAVQLHCRALIGRAAYGRSARALRIMNLLGRCKATNRVCNIPRRIYLAALCMQRKD